MISETYATMKPRRKQAQNKEGRSAPKAPDLKSGLRRVLSHRQQQRHQTYAHGDMPSPAMPEMDASSPRLRPAALTCASPRSRKPSPVTFSPAW